MRKEFKREKREKERSESEPTRGNSGVAGGLTRTMASKRRERRD